MLPPHTQTRHSRTATHRTFHHHQPQSQSSVEPDDDDSIIFGLHYVRTPSPLTGRKSPKPLKDPASVKRKQHQCDMALPSARSRNTEKILYTSANNGRTVEIRQIKIRRDLDDPESPQHPHKRRDSDIGTTMDGKEEKSKSRSRAKGKTSTSKYASHSREEERPRRHSEGKETSSKRVERGTSTRADDTRERTTLRSEKRHINEPAARHSRGRSPPPRSASTREPSRTPSFRSSIFGGRSIAKKPKPASREAPPVSYKPPKVERAASVSSRRSERPASVRASSSGPSKTKSTPAPVTKEPEEQVECLVCLSSYPSSRTALLPCEHRMCHTCLRRQFNLSLTDPQHMPPTCCTSKPIPLRHVDKLFDHKFKHKWNQKNLEFSTKNRIYCPARRCGTWIKPGEMKTDSASGRKYGKCSRCRTKVCCACNGRWHTSRTCPKDPETQEFVKIAKENGWQRCYNCSATVELKEGCNHMTCRCTAEFCMICGSKWKTCDCPWFNYQAVEADRLNHMNIPFVRQVPVGNPGLGFQQEMEQRREQERRDEAFARRVQILNLDDDDMILEQDFFLRARDILAAHIDPAQHDAAERLIAEHQRGNTHRHQQPRHRHDHFHDQDDIQNHPPAPAPPPPLRATASPLRRANTTANEHVIPRRPPERDYYLDAERHRPVNFPPAAPFPPNPELDRVENARASRMAGILRDRSATARVDEWRQWVHPSMRVS